MHLRKSLDKGKCARCTWQGSGGIFVGFHLGFDANATRVLRYMALLTAVQQCSVYFSSEAGAWPSDHIACIHDFAS